MQVRNGLYSIRIELRDGKRGHATGVIIFSDGQIRGGDTYFYYTGSYSFRNGKWRGEIITTSTLKPKADKKRIRAEYERLYLKETSHS